MAERSEFFCIKAEERNYCNCRLCIDLCDCGEKLTHFAEALYSSAKSFCERIYSATSDRNREMRERYNVTPYGFCFSVSAVPLSERIYAVTVEHSLYSRFPGGERKEGKELFLFDEVLNMPIPDSAFEFLFKRNKKKNQKSGIKYIGIEEGEIVLCCANEKTKLGFDAFEHEYLNIMRNNKKADKGIDNLKKL